MRPQRKSSELGISNRVQRLRSMKVSSHATRRNLQAFSEWAKSSSPAQDLPFDLASTVQGGRASSPRPPLFLCNPLDVVRAPQHQTAMLLGDLRSIRGVPRGPPTSCAALQLNSSLSASRHGALFSSLACCHLLGFLPAPVPSFHWIKGSPPTFDPPLNSFLSGAVHLYIFLGGSALSPINISIAAFLSLPRLCRDPQDATSFPVTPLPF